MVLRTEGAEQNTASYVGVCVCVSITARCFAPSAQRLRHIPLGWPATVFCPLQMQARALLADIHSQPDSAQVQTRTTRKAQS